MEKESNILFEIFHSFHLGINMLAIGIRYCLLILSCFCSLCSLAGAATFHVAATGHDDSGSGSAINPWATITHALDNVADDSVIEVHPGTYSGRIRIRGTFPTGVLVRSQTPYRAKLRNSDRVITAYEHPDGVRGITLEGFDIAHSGSGAGALVVHIDGGGNNSVTDITLRNNILHDSYNNDILKVNNACSNILISGNIFFNDFGASGRINQNNTSSYIVIKDSNGSEDIFLGSSNITVRRNIFLNWQGSTGNNFVLIGEDGNPYHEAFNVLLENNLMLGNSANVMRASFGVKGGRDITFRNNTVSGDLPALAYAMRLNREGSNPANQNIRFYNNAWVDQSGTMGAEDSSGSNDFSDTPPGDTSSFVLESNLYWNGGVAIPEDSSELINFSDDVSRVVEDPLLPSPVAIPLPGWQESSGQFAEGSSSIRAAFLKLASYAIPASGSPLGDRANSSFAPDDDILGNKRSSRKDIGAYEQGAGSGNTPIAPIIFLLR